MSLPTTSVDATRRAARWAPIRSLAARHRERIQAHLLALGTSDRYLRFGHAASDAQICHYIDRIDFERDEVFGIFNRRLEVVAIAHLAYLGAPDQPQTVAEFGVSVAAKSRGRGWGARLFDVAVLHARNRHVDTMLIHALTDNKAMLHIVRQAGASIELAGPDATARLKLPPENLASHVEALVESQVAEFDYGLKLQARRLDSWLHPEHPADGVTIAPPESRDGNAAPHTQARDRSEAPPV